MQHSIRVGDKVLAAMDAAGEKYAPAEVLEGFEKRSSADFYDRSKKIMNIL